MNRLHVRPWLPAVALMALSLGACSQGWGRAKNPFTAPGSDEGEITVRVENHNFGDATVHALRGGERIRLGNVTGKSEQDFTVNWTFSLPMEFEVNIIGGQGCRVRPMTVDPGDKVFVRIPTEISAQPCYSGKMR